VVEQTFADVVEPSVSVGAPYALIVKVVVDVQPPALLTVMVSVIVAPLAISFALKVYVGVVLVDPAVMLPGVPDVLLRVQSIVPLVALYPDGTV
jgi:hypothetical protein